MGDSDRFWSKVRKGDGCWEWQGAVSNRGYGSIRVNGKTLQTHRFAWELENGPIPKLEGVDSRGTCVCHRCDNPKCVNPSHLFLGTHRDNMRDLFGKGRRNTKGARHPRARLSESDVRAIKRAINNGQRVHEVAAKHGVSSSTISMIKNGSNWGHIQ